MPKFTVIAREVVTYRMEITAPTIQKAIERAEAIEWDAAEEQDSSGVGHVVEVFDGRGRKLWTFDDCDCADRSYYGKGHDSACPRHGMDEDSERATGMEV